MWWEFYQEVNELLKTKISVQQFMIIVILFTVGTSILIYPASVAAEAKQDAWITAILTTGIGLLFIWLFSALGSIVPHLTLIEMCMKLLGKWLGTIAAIIFISFFYYSTAALLFYIGNFLTTQMMPDTPMITPIILYLSILVLGVYLGIETFARFAEVVFPIVILLLLILFISSSPQFEFQNFLPVFEVGIKPIIRGGILIFINSFLMPITLLTIFPSHLNQTKQGRKAFIMGVFIGGIILDIIIVISILVLGDYITSIEMYPSYVLAQKINIGNFFQRIEAIVAIIWFITIYIKMFIYFYGTVVGLANMLKLDDYKPIVLPLGLTLVPFSLLMYPDVPYMQKWESTSWVPYALTIGIFLPLLLLGAAVFRKYILKENLQNQK
ncbi:Spore germination protein YndE [Peribacillus sp. Bi96]|nr:Spore germination protein YndE [Peribacillus sp. Bi96]